MALFDDIVSWVKRLFRIWDDKEETKPQQTQTTEKPSLVSQVATQLDDIKREVQSIQKPTLNDVASWNSTANTTLDGTINIPTTPKATTPSDASIYTNPATAPKTGQISNTIFTDLELKDTQQALADEESKNNESWRKTFDKFAKATEERSPIHAMMNFHSPVPAFKNIWNAIASPFRRWYDEVQEEFQDTAVEEKKKKTAVKYDENSGDITYLDFSWVEDYLWLTVKGKKYEWNKAYFDNLYDSYEEAVQEIESNKDMSEQDKEVWKEALYQNFMEQWKQVLSFHDDDHYNERGFLTAMNFWLPGSWRRKDRYTEDELNFLKNNDISWWISDRMFTDFLSWYLYNRKLDEQYNSRKAQEIDNKLQSEQEQNLFNYELTEESVTAKKNKQMVDIYSRPAEVLAHLNNLWELPTTEYIDANNRLIGFVNKQIEEEWRWLASPIAYYKVVQQKDPSTLTEWEKEILSYGRYLESIMDNYDDAISEIAVQNIYQWLVDWKLVQAAESIWWESITDFLYNSIVNDAYNIIWWWTMLISWWTSNAVSWEDLLQLINNKVAYDYWKDKWNVLRTTWTKVERAWWVVWYDVSMAWKVTASTTMKWIENIFGMDNRYSDYINSDMVEWMMMVTDNWAFSDLVKEYWLSWMDNVPELAWQIIAWNKVLKMLWQLPNATKVATIWGKTRRWNKPIGTWLESWLKRRSGYQAISNAISKWISSVGNSKLFRTPKDWINAVSKTLRLDTATSQAIMDLWWKIIKGTASDQFIDAMASYYDTEAYSTPSYALSVWLTGLTEVVSPILGSTQWLKRLQNIAQWKNQWIWTIWRLTSLLDSDPEFFKTFTQRVWKWALSYDSLKHQAWAFWEFENALRVAYSQLNWEWQRLVNKFTKQQIFDKLKQMKWMDWNSQFWRNLTSLLKNENANAADLFKFFLGLNWTVEYWPFMSSIKFKDWWQLQTRILWDKWYNILLDNVDNFLWKMNLGFTAEDLERLKNLKNTEWRKLFPDLDTSKAFSYDENTGKYFLNSDWAKALWVDVLDYTESLARADAIEKQAMKDKEELDVIVAKLADAKWMSEDTIRRLAQSGTYHKLVETLEEQIC